jgi:hypothetical protein
MARPFALLVLIILIVPVSGCLETSDPPKEDAYISVSRMLMHHPGGNRGWTAEVEVLTVYPAGKKIPWEEVSFFTRDGPETVVGDLQLFNGTNPQGLHAWYIKDRTQLGHIEVGDKVRFTGLNNSWIDPNSRALIKLWWGQHDIRGAALFPPLVFNLIPYKNETRTAMGEEVWDQEFRIMYKQPFGKSIWWGDMRILLIDGRGNPDEPATRLSEPPTATPSYQVACYDSDDQFDLVSDGDAITVYAMGIEYLGGRVVMEYKHGSTTYNIGWSDLPETLP